MNSSDAFAVLDVNADGVISRQEWSNHHFQKAAPKRQPRSSGGGEPRGINHLKRYVVCARSLGPVANMSHFCLT